MKNAINILYKKKEHFQQQNEHFVKVRDKHFLNTSNTFYENTMNIFNIYTKKEMKEQKTENKLNGKI